jgi:hypothetical protein
MPPLYKSKSQGLKQLALGRAEAGFRKFGKATEKIVDKAGEKASKKKKSRQQMGALLAGLLVTIATGGAAAPLLLAGATGLGSYIGGRSGASKGEKDIESQLGSIGVKPAREAGEELSSSLYEGLVTDAVKDAFMSYAGGQIADKGIQGIMPKSVQTVNPITGTPAMTKQGLPFFDKLPTPESVAGKKILGTEKKLLENIMTPKMVETPGFLEKILDFGEQVNINPFVSRGGEYVAETGLRDFAPSMFAKGARASLPMVLPQLLSMYEGR